MITISENIYIFLFSKQLYILFICLNSWVDRIVKRQFVADFHEGVTEISRMFRGMWQNLSEKIKRLNMKILLKERQYCNSLNIVINNRFHYGTFLEIKIIKQREYGS